MVIAAPVAGENTGARDIIGKSMQPPRSSTPWSLTSRWHCHGVVINMVVWLSHPLAILMGQQNMYYDALKVTGDLIVGRWTEAAEPQTVALNDYLPVT